MPSGAALQVRPFDIGPGLNAFRTGVEDRYVAGERAFQSGQRSALAEAGSMFGAGDTAGASSRLASAGMLDQAIGVRSYADSQQDRATAAQDRASAAAAAQREQLEQGIGRILSVPDLSDEQRSAAFGTWADMIGMDDDDRATLLPALQDPQFWPQYRGALGIAPAPREAPDHEVFMGPDGKPHRYGFNPQSGQYDIDLGIAASASPGQTTNINMPQIGNLRPGEMLVEDATAPGGWRIEPVPGGELDRELTANADATAAGEAAAARQDNIVLGNINTALDQIGFWSTGPVGMISRGIGGTPAFDIAETLGTIQANLGFAQLQAMRAASPNGAALGSITERELARLEATRGSLNPNQSAPQLRDNLIRLRSDILDTVHGAGNWDIDAQGNVTVTPIGGGGTTPAATARPPELTAENIRATIAGGGAGGQSEQQVIDALAQRFGVTPAQIRQWMAE